MVVWDEENSRGAEGSLLAQHHQPPRLLSPSLLSLMPPPAFMPPHACPLAGEDLHKVLWLKSRSSEVWLERRTSYTRSTAVMSMVGYILGLGDRHPSNLMLDRYSGERVWGGEELHYCETAQFVHALALHALLCLLSHPP